MRSRRQNEYRAPRRRTDAADDPPRTRLSGRVLRRTGRGGLLLVAVLLLSPGCQLNRSFFQMDSNSRVPFFGVDLSPRLPTRTSAVEGVSRLQSQTAQRSRREPETTGTPAATRSLALPLSDSVVTSTASEGSPVETFR